MTAAMDKNLFAPRPPRGWNSYDYYDTTVREEEVLANAAFLAEHLKPWGWEYVVVDIQWYAYHTGTMRDRFQYIPFGKNEMDGYGRLLPCPEKFPSSAGGAGFRPLADRIHAMGLKFGIHIMRGIPRAAAQAHLPILGASETADLAADPASICGWNPDMYGLRPCQAAQRYYDSLLELYASWGVDFLKCDDICSTSLYPDRPYSARHEVEMLHRAILRCGRPIVLSLSPGPALTEESWHYRKYANLWRLTDDLWDNWEDLSGMFDRCEKWQDHVSPGCYPDCDMLPLGRIGRGFGQERNTRLTWEEQRTMMTLWCIFGSPLMVGSELTALDGRTLSLLRNPAVLRLEDGGFLSRQVRRDREQRVWAAANPAAGESYVALFNLSGGAREMAVSLAECRSALPGGDFQTGPGELLEVWSGQRAAVRDGMIGGTVPPHGVLLFHRKRNTQEVPG